MTDALILDLPVLSLFLKFMIASTALLGGVWLLEKIGVINSPDMSEMAWKLAIVASFIALTPVSLFSTSVTIPVSNSAADQIIENSASSTRVPTGVTLTEREITERLAPAPASAPRPEPYSPARAGGSINGPEGNNDIEREDGLNPSPAYQTQHDDSTAFTPQPSLISGFTGREAPKANSSLSLPGILLVGGWAALALVALVALFVSYFRAVKSLGTRSRVPAEHHANQTLRALCEQVDIRHVPFLTRSSEINSPVCLPRREICLPDWAFEDMDRKALDSLIAHELAHMLRRDPVMMIITQTLSRVFFFQPLFAVARRRLEDNAELAADQWAATHLSTAKAVANALYTCAKKITEKRQIQWGLAMAGDKSILKQRVERLLKADASSFTAGGRLQRTGIAIAAMLTVVSLPGVEFATAMNAEHPHDIELDIAEIEAEIERAIKDTDMDVDAIVREALKASRIGMDHAKEIAAQAHIIAAEARANALAHKSEIAAEAYASAMEAKAKIQEKMKRKHAGNSYTLSRDNDGWTSGNMQFTVKGTTYKVAYDGEFDLADDERSIKQVEEDGSLNIRTEKDDERRRYRLENDGDGLEVTYWVDSSKQPFDADGEKWLADTLQILLKNSAIDMDGRVERALKKGGVKNALKKLDDLDSDYATRMFVTHLVDQAKLKTSEVKRLMKQVASVESDYEIRLISATLLDKGLITKDTLSAALDLSEKVDSDYELRLMLSPLIDTFALDDKNMTKVLQRAKSIDSDYELRLLLGIALDEHKLSKANQKRLIETMSSIESDYELRLLISHFADDADLDQNMTADLLKALGSIDGDYEKRLGLAVIVDQGSMSNANWLSAIKIASSIGGDHEKRLALSQIKDDMPGSKSVEDAFNDAAQSISGKHERELLIGRTD